MTATWYTLKQRPPKKGIEVIIQTNLGEYFIAYLMGNGLFKIKYSGIMVLADYWTYIPKRSRHKEKTCTKKC